MPPISEVIGKIKCVPIPINVDKERSADINVLEHISAHAHADAVAHLIALARVRDNDTMPSANEVNADINYSQCVIAGQEQVIVRPAEKEVPDTDTTDIVVVVDSDDVAYINARSDVEEDTNGEFAPCLQDLVEAAVTAPYVYVDTSAAVSRLDLGMWQRKETPIAIW